MRLIIFSLIILSLLALRRPPALRHKFTDWPHVTKIRDAAWAARSVPITEVEIHADIVLRGDPSPYSLQFNKRIAARRYYLRHHSWDPEIMSDLEFAWRNNMPEKALGGTTELYSFWAFFVTYKRSVLDEVESQQNQ